MARPKIIKAGGGERGQFIMREFNDNTVRFVLNYPGIVNVEVSRDAVANELQYLILEKGVLEKKAMELIYRSMQP